MSKPAADLARPDLLLKLLTSLPACGACSPSQRLRLLLQTLPFGLLIERLMLQWDVQLPRRLHGRVVLAAHLSESVQPAERPVRESALCLRSRVDRVGLHDARMRTQLRRRRPRLLLQRHLPVRVRMVGG